MGLVPEPGWGLEPVPRLKLVRGPVLEQEQEQALVSELVPELVQEPELVPEQAQALELELELVPELAPGLGRKQRPVPHLNQKDSGPEVGAWTEWKILTSEKWNSGAK